MTSPIQYLMNLEAHSPIIISQLLESVCLCSKAIPLNDFQCKCKGFFSFYQDDSLDDHHPENQFESDLSRSTIVPASSSPFDWERVGSDNRRHSFCKLIWILQGVMTYYSFCTLIWILQGVLTYYSFYEQIRMLY